MTRQNHLIRQVSMTEMARRIAIKNSEDMSGTITSALRDDLKARGLSAEAVQNDVTIMLDSHGKTTLTMELRGAAVKPFSDLAQSLCDNAGQHSFRLSSFVKDQKIILEAYSRGDMISGINAALSDPKLRIQVSNSKT